MGPRNCIGMRFALQTITLVIVEILQNFSFVTCKETEVRLLIVSMGLLVCMSLCVYACKFLNMLVVNVGL